MKHIKLFENFKMNESIDFILSDAINWIQSNYSEDRVTEMKDEEIVSGNWVDKEQMEEEGYEEEYEYYVDFGRGEAEDAVMDSIILDYKSSNNVQNLSDNDEVSLYEWLKEEYPVLNHNL